MPREAEQRPAPGAHVQGNRPAPNPGHEANPPGFDVAVDMARAQRDQVNETPFRGVPVPPPEGTST